MANPITHPIYSHNPTHQANPLAVMGCSAQEEEEMTSYLRYKWVQLRLYRALRMFEINYRILRNTAKMMGATHENRA